LRHTFLTDKYQDLPDDLPDEVYSTQNKSLESNQAQKRIKTPNRKDEHIFLSNTLSG
jgi:hypothetical protein